MNGPQVKPGFLITKKLGSSCKINIKQVLIILILQVSQSGTALLDKFSHCLMAKCNVDMLDVLLNTLIRQLQLPTLAERQDAKMVAKRYTVRYIF